MIASITEGGVGILVDMKGAGEGMIWAFVMSTGSLIFWRQPPQRERALLLIILRSSESACWK